MADTAASQRMENGSGDQEIRNLIMESLIKLAASKEWDEIKVVAICDEAHVSRQTFYQYFRNKLDVILWSTEEDLNAFFLLSDPFGWNSTLKYLLDDHTSKATLLNKVLGSSDRRRYLESFADLNKAFLTRQLHARGIELDDELEFYVGGCSQVIVSIIEDWVLAERGVETGTLVLWIEEMMPAKLKNLLAQPILSEFRKRPYVR